MYEKIELGEILLEITTRCNLNCLHCFNRPNDNNIDMSFEEIDFIINKCKKYGANKIAISGGEPLVHLEIKEIIKNCAKYPDIQFLITTNGLLLNKELILLIQSIPNIEVQISIDGTTKEIYEATRGLDTFCHFIKGLSLLVKSEIKNIHARTCITKLNYRNVEEIYEMAIRNKINLSFLFISPQGNAVKNVDDLSLSIAQKIHVIDTLNRLNERYNVNVEPPSITNQCDYAEDLERKHLIIKADGDIAPCQYYYNESIGNMLDTELEQILNYDNLKEMYNNGKKRKEALSKTQQCGKCKLHPICRMGCMGLAKEKGNEMGFDGECEYKEVLESCYSNKFIKSKKEF